MKSILFSRSSAALLILLACSFGHAHAFTAGPEIDPSLAVSGLALLAGAALMIKARRKS